MKTFLRLTIAITILLFACNVWAQNRPQCPIDPDSGWIPMADAPGACFAGTTGWASWTEVFDGQKRVWVFDNTGANDFLRLDPNGKGFWHQSDKDGNDALLCANVPCGSPWDPNNPKQASWFWGTVTITANTSMYTDMDGVWPDCPYTVQIKGELADNFGTGNPVKLHALNTWVPDPDSDWGCRVSMIKIDIDPID